MAGLTHTGKSQDSSALDGHALVGSLEGNDNLTLDQVSLFVSGRIADNVGIFSQLTYDGIARHTSIDNIDLRAATTTPLPGDHIAVLGVSVNNNPGVQDPFNTLPAWLFPYISSNVAPVPSASAILDEAFGQKATGIVGYAQLDGTWYGELGTYRMQTPTLQKDFGIAPADRDPGALRSPLYARFAARTTLDSSSMEAGVVLFKTGVQPDRSAPDVAHIRDIVVLLEQVLGRHAAALRRQRAGAGLARDPPAVRLDAVRQDSTQRGHRRQPARRPATDGLRQARRCERVGGH
ncbi:MAG: hypothetical protein JF586_15445 [Burkholderiales bacterium]|nr:hypothetical protein [Burkholderiales bacterium]